MESALDPFVEQIENDVRPKGFHEGRDVIMPYGISLLERSLRAVTPPTPQPKYTMTVNGIKIPITTSGSNQPQSIPVKNWHSPAEVLEAIQEYLDEVEDEKRLDPEQEKIDAYDRAMSIL